MTSSSNSSQSTRPVGQVLWEELLVLSRFHSILLADEWNFCPLQISYTFAGICGEINFVNSLPPVKLFMLF